MRANTECCVLLRPLGVPVEAMEDALCNWQKRLKAQRDARQTGFGAKTCPYRFVPSPHFAGCPRPWWNGTHAGAAPASALAAGGLLGFITSQHLRY